MNKLPLLISYAYRKSMDWNLIQSYSKDIDLLVDSGAFTAFKRGKPVQLNEYHDWLDWVLGGLNIPCRYFQLDVIGDEVKTWDNLLAMQTAGFKPIPIFTRGSDIEKLAEMYSMSPLIALGGVQMKSENSPGYVKWFMRMNQDRPVHWLGFADQPYLLAYRPTSADASNWATTLMWGDILLWMRGKFHKVSRKTWPKYSSYIESLGYDPGILADPQAWVNTLVGNGCYAQKITAASYLNYIDQMKERTGVQVYMVITDKREFNLLYPIFKERNQS